jgi:hypothetical protein
MNQHTYTYPEATPLLKHPMNEYISFWACEKTDCSAENIWVSAAGYSVHPHSGDAYGDYTLICKLCGKVELKSFADN